MRTLVLSFFLVMIMVLLSYGAPKKSPPVKKSLNVKNVVELCGEPDASYKIPNVLGLADFMLFVHNKCIAHDGAVAVVFQGEPIDPAIKIAEAIVGLYLIERGTGNNLVAKRLKAESVMMGAPPGTIKVTVIMFELKNKKRKKR